MSGPTIDDKAQPKTSQAAWLWRQTAGQRHRYLIAILALLCGALLLYVPPMIIAAAIDYVIAGNQDSTPAISKQIIGWMGGRDSMAANLWLAGGAVVLITALAGAFMYLKSRQTALACENIARNLRDKLYNHLQHLPCRWHDTVQTGDIVQRCSSDVETVRQFYSNQSVEIVRASMLLVTAVPLMILFDWVMGLVAIALLPIIVTFAVIFFGKVKDRFKAMDEAEGAMTTVLQENLTGIRVVRAFARQDFEKRKFADKNNDHRDKNWGLFKIMAIYWASSDFLCFSQLTLVMIVGATRVASGDMTVGTLVAFLSYVNIYLWPVRMMGRILTETGKAMVATKRIREVVDAPEEQPPADAQPLPAAVAGHVVFDRVSFKHRDTLVLNEISLEIEAGKTLALLGPSGSGKSTIAQLLMRFYEPDTGTITIDGVDIRRVPQKQVRAVVSSVMQEPFLYGKTLKENIRLGRPSAEEGEVVSAAQVAQIHDSIERFESRYDTVIGERGVTLSGGQRQRVAIARALLKDAPVLILDDALSAVDTRTESLILEALRRRKGKHTTILIAHRLSTLQHADEIIVLEQGRIVQRGTHASLLSVDGMYRRLWQIQTALEEDLAAELETPTPDATAELVVPGSS